MPDRIIYMFIISIALAAIYGLVVLAVLCIKLISAIPILWIFVPIIIMNVIGFVYIIVNVVREW